MGAGLANSIHLLFSLDVLNNCLCPEMNAMVCS